VCGCSGAVGASVVVTDLWLQICVLVSTCACWCLVEEVVPLSVNATDRFFRLFVFGGGEELRW
jgi:hypothetical protein